MPSCTRPVTRMIQLEKIVFVIAAVYMACQASTMPSSNKRQPLIPRFSAENQNFVSKWQIKGDLYISYANLQSLNKQCMTFEDKGAEDTRTLLNEVMMTYFARFHNVLRDEFQYEKEAVEERLKTWPVSRLAKEGFALFNMYGRSKGGLYQDQVFRFKLGGKDMGSKPLPFHRFSVGDSIVISPHRETSWGWGGASGEDTFEGELDMRNEGDESGMSKSRRNRAQGGSMGDPLSESAIDGIILARRRGYLDVSVKALDALEIRRDQAYRLDTVVNRVSYDRMINSLQLFLQVEDGVPPLSRTLRDVILYSYPNSISRLATAPGGLRLALPLKDVMGSSSSAESTLGKKKKMDRSAQKAAESVLTRMSSRTKLGNDDDVLARLEAVLDDDDKAIEKDEKEARRRSRHSGRYGSIDFAVEDADDYDQYDEDESSEGDEEEPFRGLHQPSVRARNKEAEVLLKGLQSMGQPTAEASAPASAPRPGKLTVAEQLRLLQEDGLTSSSSAQSPEGVYYDFPEGIMSSDMEGTHLDTESVFHANEKLRSMTQHASMGGTTPYTTDEINQAIDMLTKPEGFRGLERRGGLFRDAQRKTKAVRLNQSQMKALFTAVKRPLSLIQGPPGTGKTTTACSILSALTVLKENRLVVGGDKAKGQKNMKILCCAHSNVATDNLLKGLADMGLNVIRLGRPTNVQTELWNYTLDANLQNDPMWVQARSRLDRTIAYYGEMREIGGPQFGVAQRMMESAQNRFFRVEQKCSHQLLNLADVVVSTCIGAGGDVLREYMSEEGNRFSTVLLDEAAQCMESALLPAIVLGAERLILIGDQNQLPPVVASPKALDHGLGVSLFARLAAGGIEPILLDEQHRMHPKIAEFPSARFYSGKVKSRVKPDQRPLPSGFHWPNPGVPVCFIDVGPNLSKLREMEADESLVSVPTSGGYESVTSTGGAGGSTATSYFNDREADEVVKIIESLLEGSCTPEDIGVISPYSGQVKLLADRFKQLGWIDEESTSNDLGEQYRDVSMGSGSSSGVTGGGSASGERSERIRTFTRKDNGRDKGGEKAGQSDFRSEEEREDEENLMYLGLLTIGKRGVKAIKRVEDDTGLGTEATDAERDSRKLNQGARAEAIQGKYPELFDKSDEMEELAWTPTLYSGKEEDEKEDILSGIRADLKELDNLREDSGANKSRGEQKSLDSSSRGRLAEVEKQQNIEVRSVDGYQGREKVLIVFSAVRSNRLGRVGFLKDWRRLNVALTRARNGIIVVGDAQTLRYERNWRAFISWCQVNRVFITRK